MAVVELIKVTSGADYCTLEPEHYRVFARRNFDSPVELAA